MWGSEHGRVAEGVKSGNDVNTALVYKILKKNLKNLIAPQVSF